MATLGLDRTRVAVTHCAWRKGAYSTSQAHVAFHYRGSPRRSRTVARTENPSPTAHSARTLVRDRRAFHISIRHISRHPRSHRAIDAAGGRPRVSVPRIDTGEAPQHANLRPVEHQLPKHVLGHVASLRLPANRAQACAAWPAIRDRRAIDASCIFF